MFDSKELKRKLFHNLSLVYLTFYAVAPRMMSVIVLGCLLAVIEAIEFIRVRRPEVNVRFLDKFGGLHRESEILLPSGIFWTLLGSWLTMVIFTNKRIVLPALGFLSFGDTLAALGGKKWGRRAWAKNPAKTMEGSACFAAVAAVWALPFLRWPVAILGGLSGAWIESRPLPYNDNLWVPVLSGAALSVINLAIGR